MARATYMLGLRLPVPERTGFVDSTLPQILLAQFFEFRFDQNLEITSSFFRFFYFQNSKNIQIHRWVYQKIDETNLNWFLQFSQEPTDFSID
jgi:hypothetical protein